MLELSKSSVNGTRGDTITTKVVRENVLLLFGCKPSLGVERDTYMVRELIQTLIRRLDVLSLSLDLPDALDQLQSVDASFEMVASNSLKPLRLFYEHNTVTKKACLIIVNTASEYNGKRLAWKNAA